MTLFRSKPPHDASGKTRREKLWRFAKVATMATFIVGIIGIFTFTLFAAWISRDLPDPNTLNTREIPQSTKIFDRTGKVLLYEVHGDEQRTLVKLEDIPTYSKYATISIEDKKFYEHHGIYWQGLIRAFVMSVVKGQKVQGTSTLTQQLVKNAILNNERSLMRKLKEFLLALQIERQYSKDQILQMYLNEIPYGSSIYGIESAAQTFFGKPAKELTLDEAAILAAIPQSPTRYSPYGNGIYGDNRAQLVGRQHYILDQMAEQGYITKDEAETAKKIDTLKKIKPKQLGEIKAPHFVMYVKSLLEEKYGVKRVEEGGLTVVTSLDWDKQQVAEDEVKKGVEARGKQYDFSNAALVSLDPKNGQILAMVGSKDYFDTTIDGNYNVTLSPRQPGSSFKPIVYAVGFMKGYRPETQLWDVATNFRTDGRNYTPQNYSGKENGPVAIRNALQQSLNIPAVKMLYLVGVGRVLDFADELGYTTLSDRSRFGLSLVLGGGEVKPLEHADAYSAFANDGVEYPTAAILNVKDNAQQTLEEWQQPEGKRVMDEQIARLVSNVLSDNDARGNIFARNVLVLPDRQVAAKTGTTNNFHDAWTAGYTPNLTTVVWVGNNDNHEMKRGADGSVVAAPIWQGYMKRATKDMPIEKFTPPLPATTDKPAILGTAFQQKIVVDKFSGKRATEQTPPEWKEERTFYEAHDLLYYVDKDDPTGPAPANPTTDPMFTTWETAVQAWVTKNNWHTTDTAPLLYDDVHTVDNQPRVTILSPTDNVVLGSRDVTVQTNIQAIRPIIRLEAALNNAVIAIGNGSQLSWNIHIPNGFEAGFYELEVSAIDDAGNRGSAKITINLMASRDTRAEIQIVNPAGGTTWSRASFPKGIDLQIPNPSLYRRVDVSFVGEDGERRLVASETDPYASTFHVNIPLGPPSGNYRLNIQAYQRDTDIVDDAGVPIIITE